MRVIKGKRYLTVPEFAGRIRVCRRTIERWLAFDLPLPSVKLGPNRGRGSLLLIPSAEAFLWIDKHAPTPPPGRRDRRFILPKGS